MTQQRSGERRDRRAWPLRPVTKILYHGRDVWPRRFKAIELRCCLEERPRRRGRLESANIGCRTGAVEYPEAEATAAAPGACRPLSELADRRRLETPSLPGVFLHAQRGETVRVDCERSTRLGRTDGEFGRLDQVSLALACCGHQVCDRGFQLRAGCRIGGVIQE